MQQFGQRAVQRCVVPLTQHISRIFQTRPFPLTNMSDLYKTVRTRRGENHINSIYHGTTPLPDLPRLDIQGECR